ncbi:MAG: M20/M25/M40 family metallo-hydrolase [Candidatus Krumholzibacteria bacterium]|nr:M20/M25/M40 family metallo-hydrolase [Candidatus Krumholzibacteria bacterium]
MNALGFLLLVSALAIDARADAGDRAPMPAREAQAAPREESWSAFQAAVQRDSLESMVRFLSIDTATGGSRTRFALREAPLGLVADSLEARLARYTGAAVERFPFSFDKDFASIDSSYTGENLVARVAGNGIVSGAFLVTAHYDAIASRTSGWEANWRTWPAPGADDNSTGVAALMEAARVLSGHDLPFDVMFVLFSSEELGLIGSRAFVEKLPDIDPARIIGVLNCDMIGYPFAGYPAGTVISNPASDWLSGLIAQAAGESDPSFPIVVLSPGPSNWDHAPFWEALIPAVTFTEPLRENMLIGSPYYHTLADTVGTLDFEQVERMTNIVVDFVERIAAAGAEAALFPSDVVLLKRGYPNTSRVFAVGDTMTVRAAARNRGSADAPAGSSMRLTISIENGSFMRTLYSEVLPIPAALDADAVEAKMVLDRSFLGADKIGVSISVRGMSDDPDNNAVEMWMAVEGEEDVVLMHTVQPNPVTEGLRSAFFCMNLARGVDMSLSLYNLEGELIGTAYAGSRWGQPLVAGLNRLGMSALFPRIDRLASGVYFYRLVVYDEGIARTSYPGRFAIQE